jgi:hypothetical protein
MSSEQNIEIETLEIADLEYEVGGTNAVEAADSHLSHRDNVIIMMPL